MEGELLLDNGVKVNGLLIGNGVNTKTIQSLNESSDDSGLSESNEYADTELSPRKIHQNGHVKTQTTARRRRRKISNDKSKLKVNGVIEERGELKAAKVIDSESDGEYGISSGYAFHCKGTLFSLEEMPPYLQFNKHVHKGYRGLMTFTECLYSLTYWHNESLNIFTHIFPIVFVAIFWQQMFPWEFARGNFLLNFLGYTHVLGSVTPWLGSVTYHLFMPMNKGHWFYKKLLQIDMTGIWFTETFGAMTLLTASGWCLNPVIQFTCLALYGFAAAFGLFKALTAWSPLARRLCFAPVFISRILVFILRLTSYGGGDPNMLIHIILQDAVSIFGGVIGVIRIPERWFSGKLDNCFNSHMIMHILVVLAVLHMNAATNGDCLWIIANWNKCPGVNSINNRTDAFNVTSS